MNATIDTGREQSVNAAHVTTLTINRSANLGRQFRARESELPRLTASVDVPQELVATARTLYQHYHDVNQGAGPAEQTFAEYLHDIVLEQLTLEFQYPETNGRG